MTFRLILYSNQMLLSFIKSKTLKYKMKLKIRMIKEYKKTLSYHKRKTIYHNLLFYKIIKTMKISTQYIYKV